MWVWVIVGREECCGRRVGGTEEVSEAAAVHSGRGNRSITNRVDITSIFLLSILVLVLLIHKHEICVC